MAITIIPTSTARKSIKHINRSWFHFSQGVRRGLFAMGKDAAIESARMINNSGRSGRVYMIEGFPHVSSAPGQAPANITGRLRRSFNYRVQGVYQVEWGATSASPYAKWLELGTKNMSPRPTIQVVAKKRGLHHARYLEREVHDAIRRRR